MKRKLLILILLITTSFSLLISEVENTNLSKPLKLKLIGQEKYKTHLLCFTENGFVTWSSTLFAEENIPKFAEYHAFDELNYFQLKGKFSSKPLLIGGGFVGGTALLALVNDDKEDDFAFTYFALLGGLISSAFFLLSPLKPRYSRPDTKTKIEKFPEKYVTFNSDIPAALQEFIDLYEE